MMSYEPKKAAQLIAALILRSGGQAINVVKAVKLIYLADRESIARFGLPILDEMRVSMRLGPVNSDTYRHVNGEADLRACGWSDFLEDRENHNIALASSDISLEDLDELSDADLQCVDAVVSRFGHMNQWDLVNWTHDPENVPEWEDPHGSSKPIPLLRIMRAVGLERPEDFSDLADAQRGIDNSFAMARSH